VRCTSARAAAALRDRDGDGASCGSVGGAVRWDGHQGRRHRGDHHQARHRQDRRCRGSRQGVGHQGRVRHSHQYGLRGRPGHLHGRPVAPNQAAAGSACHSSTLDDQGAAESDDRSATAADPPAAARPVPDVVRPDVGSGPEPEPGPAVASGVGHPARDVRSRSGARRWVLVLAQLRRQQLPVRARARQPVVARPPAPVRARVPPPAPRRERTQGQQG